MSVHHAVPAGVRGKLWVPWSCSYRWLCATTWVPGAARATSDLTAEPSLQTPHFRCAFLSFLKLMSVLLCAVVEEKGDAEEMGLTWVQGTELWKFWLWALAFKGRAAFPAPCYYFIFPACVFSCWVLFQSLALPSGDYGLAYFVPLFLQSLSYTSRWNSSWTCRLGISSQRVDFVITQCPFYGKVYLLKIFVCGAGRANPEPCVYEASVPAPSWVLFRWSCLLR